MPIGNGTDVRCSDHITKNNRNTQPSGIIEGRKSIVNPLKMHNRRPNTESGGSRSQTYSAVHGPNPVGGGGGGGVPEPEVISNAAFQIQPSPISPRSKITGTKKIR